MKTKKPEPFLISVYKEVCKFEALSKKETKNDLYLAEKNERIGNIAKELRKFMVDQCNAYIDTSISSIRSQLFELDVIYSKEIRQCFKCDDHHWASILSESMHIINERYIENE